MSQFPIHYKPRPYQVELHSMWATNKYGIAVMPRQSGKDMSAIMEQVRSRLITPNTTGVYIGLSNPEIKNIIWQKSYECPDCEQHVRALQGNVPKELVKWRDSTTEANFTNGSWLKALGFFQSGQDKGGVGTSFQDYTITELALFGRENPVDRLWPIIENQRIARLMAVSTPRGRRNNPLWNLIQSVEGRKDAQVIVRTIDDCNEMMVREGMPPVLHPEQLEKIRDTYLKRFGNDRMFEQEYYCSFDEMDAAAVYGEAYKQMVLDRRTEDFNLDPKHPVYVVFDIGSAGKHSDATSWMAFQWFNNKLFIYDCGEGHGKALPDYVDDLHAKHYFNRIKTIILPWDGEHHEKSINLTPADMMRQRFPHVDVLAKSNKVYKIPGRSQWGDTITDIQATRLALYNTYINGANCQWVFECLEQYKYQYSTKMQEWSDQPVHDKFSHMMDALRYAVQSTRELDFFQGGFMGNTDGVTDYTESGWAGAWA